jgi:hypothetical protein
MSGGGDPIRLSGCTVKVETRAECRLDNVHLKRYFHPGQTVSTI